MSEPVLIEKNAREVIRLSWETYEGHRYIDARLYFWVGDDLRPTRKGLVIRPNLLGAVIAGLKEFAEVGDEQA